MPWVRRRPIRALAFGTRALRGSSSCVSNCLGNIPALSHAFFFFKQKTAYEIHSWLEFRRVLFRSPEVRPRPAAESARAWRYAPRGAGARGDASVLRRHAVRRREGVPSDSKRPRERPPAFELPDMRDRKSVV